MPGPVFIVGSPRSGTTLLRMVLNTHPRIAMPHECDVVYTVMRSYPDPDAPLADLNEFVRLVSDVRRFHRVFGMSVGNLEACCRACDRPTPAALLARIYRASQGADPGDDSIVWGDKYILLGEYVAELARYFPPSRFIHLVRDARDSVASIRENFSAHRTPSGRFFATRSLVGAALLWRHMVDACDRDAGALGPERSIAVRYEDLVRDVEPVTQRICEFIGVPFAPEMLEPERRAAGKNAIPEDSAARYHANVSKPLDSGLIGRGSRDLGRRDLAVIETICGEPMRRHGYETTGDGAQPGLAVRSRLVNYRVSAFLEDAGRRVARTVLPARSADQDL